MRIVAVLATGLLASLAITAPAISAEAPDSSCIAGCDAKRDACNQAAEAEAKRCREKALAACDDWCPCDQFIGAAHFACIPECERCMLDADDDAARCPDGSAEKAECATAHRRCMQDCAGSE